MADKLTTTPTTLIARARELCEDPDLMYSARTLLPELADALELVTRECDEARVKLTGVADGHCVYSGPGRGDCEHFLGLPGKSIPGQHDGQDDTVDHRGKPNGWCQRCWDVCRIEGLERGIRCNANACDVHARKNDELKAETKRLEHSLSDAMEQIEAIQGSNATHMARVAKLEAELSRVVESAECLSEAAAKHPESQTADGVAAAASVVLRASSQSGEEV